MLLPMPLRPLLLTIRSGFSRSLGETWVPHTPTAISTGAFNLYKTSDARLNHFMEVDTQMVLMQAKKGNVQKLCW